MFSLFPHALRSTVYLTTLSKDQTNVRWDPVSTFYFHDVSNHQLLCWQFLLFCISDDKSLLKDISVTKISIVSSSKPPTKRYFGVGLIVLLSFWGALLEWTFISKCIGGSHLWNHFTEAGHDVCAFSFLIVSEDTSEDDNQGQNYSKVELMNKRHNPVNLRQLFSNSSARINRSSVWFQESLKMRYHSG